MNAMEKTLWSDLQASGFVSGDCPRDSETSDPWYLKVLMGFGGWLGALCLIGFIAIDIQSVIETASVAVAVGVTICVGAGFGYKRATNLFINQFLLAMSFAGQFLVVFGAWRMFSFNTAIFSLLMLCFYALLFAFIRDFLHRTIASVGAAWFLALLMAQSHLAPVISGLLMLLAVTALFKELEYENHVKAVSAFAYGFLLMALATIFLPQNFWIVIFRIFENTRHLDGLPSNYWVGAAFNSLVFLGVVYWLMNELQLEMKSLSAGLLTLVSLLIAGFSLKASALPLILALLLAAFARSNRVITGIGVLATLAYMSQYYYFMQISLLEKSILLMATGVAILIMRMVINRVFEKAQNNEATSHA